MARRLIAVVAAFALMGGVALASGATVTSKTLTSFSTTPKSCTFVAVADGWIEQKNDPAGSGGTTSLSVGPGNGSTLQRAFVKFDLTATSRNTAGCSDLTAANLQQAKLTLTASTVPTASRSHSVYAVTGGDWSDASSNPTLSFKWSTQPAVASSASASATVPTTAGPVSWTATSDVKSFINGTSSNFGWMIRDDSEINGSNSTGTAYRSREFTTASARPTLTLYYIP